ncbi:hypothetical protein ACFQUU_08935 [Herbaspirillum sp. GCM10030257]|uniref:hypothetical protein n=1 Tax=Herbaspirillum sp. GCM10030257 TaxID=3273393 RepID=UPI00361812A4
MLNIYYKRDSKPIDDEDMRSVRQAVTPIIAAGPGPEKDYALLLAKMMFRIEALQGEIARMKRIIA